MTRQLIIQIIIIGLLLLFIIIQTIRKLKKLNKTDNPRQIRLTSILLTGILTFFVALFLGNTNMINAFDRIQSIEYVNQKVILEGVKKSIEIQNLGLAVMIFSTLIWTLIKIYIFIK